ncbi:hypothetical protein [Xenorhabdus bovienii]|uniref:hypothetical protein n=1 Tax=Xenorhabdus bovienii TaxID=40576 RepID=UPI0023B255F9|nr:hypothetical protein [Xenorhabdus bovienii]
MLAIALEAVKSLRTMTVDAFQVAGTFDYKPDHSVVTQTDLRVDQLSYMSLKVREAGCCTVISMHVIAVFQAC